MNLSLKIMILMTSVALMCCRGHNTSECNADSDSVAINDVDYVEDAEQWADSVYESMTPGQRAGQLLMPGIYAKSDPANIALLKRYIRELHVGGIVLLKGTASETKILCDSIKRWTRLPVFVAIDAEWGLGMRLTDAESFPVNSKLGGYTTTQMYDYGYKVGTQAGKLGINMILGPVMDISPADGSGYIGFRTFPGDAERVSDLGVAYAHGLEDSGVLSCAKHFPGHGSVRGDSHKIRPIIRKSLEELRREDLKPFSRYSQEGLSGVMVGHLSVPSIDSTGRSASGSSKVIGELLRKEIGFGGLVLTDALNMGGAKGLEEVESIKAGADIIVAPADTKLSLERLIENPAATIASTKRILRFKYPLRR
ncbi:MAG: glycosyl hydrolase family 3 [Prevotella sp.]|nr:glycosyl hydrolase family 3 [Bacteroides sp.]MCM1366714.1 glycosyl hydrolase family 3 [Prevotella sp.]MCM1437272.1 glycosyl hydrolase family 3 [Prevotella sp.]